MAHTVVYKRKSLWSHPVTLILLGLAVLLTAGMMLSLQKIFADPAETAAPAGGTITYPLHEVTKINTNQTITATGVAKDTSNVGGVNPSINQVRIALKNLDTQEWLQADGSWLGGEGTRTYRLATLGSSSTNGGVLSQSWSWTSPSLPNGYYQLEAQALDDSSNFESGFPKARFFVDNSGPGDTQRPTNGVITTPIHSTQSGQTYTMSSGAQLTAQGIASDTTNDPLTSAEVKTVYVAVKVRNTDPVQWLQNDTGTPTFGTTRQVFQATLGNPYVDGSTIKRAWSWQSPAMPTGTYSLEAQATDSTDYREGTGQTGQYLCRTGETCLAYPFAWFIVTSGTTGDTTAPAQGIFSTPATDQTFTPSTAINFGGTAYDTSNDSAVAPTLLKVMVAIKDKGNGQWLQDPSTMTWGATRTAFQASLIGSPVTAGGVTSQSWSYSLSSGLLTGSYMIEAQAFDTYNNKEVPAAKKDFGVGQLDTQAPAWSTITAPLPHATWAYNGTHFVTGVARDTSNGSGGSPSVSNISKVKIAVKNIDTGQYFQSNGTMGTARATFEATLGSFNYVSSTGTWNQNWTWSAPAQLPTGDYVISAQAYDLANNPETSNETIGYDGIPTTRVAVGASTGTAYLTISLGRTQWQQWVGTTCTTAVSSSSGSLMTLDQVASAMDARTRPLWAVGNVTPNRTSSTSTKSCIGGITYPTWSDLGTLSSSYDWKFVSTGQAYTELDSTTFPYLDPDNNTTVSTLNDEICGSISSFTANGHNYSHGFFAYPNNRFPAGTENPAKSCFLFGRKYQAGINIKANAADPWWAKTNSINGGLCADSAETCYTISGVPGANGSTRRYTDPAQVGRLMSPRIGTWAIVQMYRFVQGSKTTGSGPNWDCTSTDWKKHWTSQTELYCWNDFETAMDMIPSYVQLQDATGVASNWGRSL